MPTLLFALLLACSPATVTPPGGGADTAGADGGVDTAITTDGGADTAGPGDGGADTAGPGDGGGAADTGADTAAPGDTGDTGDGVEHVPGVDPDYDPSDVLFTLDEVHSLDIELGTDARAALVSDPYTFVTANVIVDGHRIDDVGIRLAGKLGSFRTMDQKAGFKIDLDRFVAGQTYLGLKRIVAKNLVQDSSYIHERIAFQIYEAMGVAAPRVGYLWVTVNGQDYGLYADMEAVDDRFLSRAYADPTGNLYDGDYVLNETGSSYTLLDFNTTTQQLMNLDEGTDVDHADIRAVTRAVDRALGTGDWETPIGAVIDLDHHLRFMSVELWVGQYDGYSNYTNNYRVYFDPTDGLARLHPWDHDWAFYSSSPLTPQYGRLSVYCYADAACKADYLATMETLCETVPELNLLDEVDRAVELLAPYIEVDPRREMSLATVGSYQASLRSWIAHRNETVAATYGIPCGA